MSRDMPLKADAAALPGGTEQLRHRGLDALPGVRATSFTPRRPRRLNFRRNSLQIGAASEVPTSSPGTSRRPSVSTPMAVAVAMITATDTVRHRAGA